MNPADVTISYTPTASAASVFEQAGGASLPDRLPVLPVTGDELVIGAVVFSVLRRRIDPGPPARVLLTLDHPARPAALR